MKELFELVLQQLAALTMGEVPAPVVLLVAVALAVIIRSGTPPQPPALVQVSNVAGDVSIR